MSVRRLGPYDRPSRSYLVEEADYWEACDIVRRDRKSEASRQLDRRGLPKKR